METGIFEIVEKLAIGAAAFIYFLDRIFRSLKDKKQSKAIGEIQKSIVKPEKSICQTSEQVIAIDRICNEIVGYFSDRPIASVLLWQFNNGSYSGANFSYKFASCVGEAVSPGRERTRKHLQNRPMYDYSILLVDIKNTEEKQLFYNYNSYPSSIISTEMHTRGIFSCIETALSDNLDKGLLSVSFYTECDIYSDDFEYLKICASRIYSILSNNI
jgi:hypothetical protein